jgi:hypothetical protein
MGKFNRIIIDAGDYKTGSTSRQVFLDAFRDRLLTANIAAYCPDTSHEKLFKSFASSSGIFLCDLSKWIDSVNHSGILIISCECFSDLVEVELRALRNWLLHWSDKIEVLYWFRNAFSFSESIMTTKVKLGQAISMIPLKYCGHTISAFQLVFGADHVFTFFESRNSVIDILDHIGFNIKADEGLINNAMSFVNQARYNNTLSNPAFRFGINILEILTRQNIIIDHKLYYQLIGKLLEEVPGERYCINQSVKNAIESYLSEDYLVLSNLVGISRTEYFPNSSLKCSDSESNALPSIDTNILTSMPELSLDTDLFLNILEGVTTFVANTTADIQDLTESFDFSLIGLAYCSRLHSDQAQLGIRIAAFYAGSSISFSFAFHTANAVYNLTKSYKTNSSLGLGLIVEQIFFDSSWGIDLPDDSDLIELKVKSQLESGKVLGNYRLSSRLVKCGFLASGVLRNAIEQGQSKAIIDQFIFNRGLSSLSYAGKLQSVSFKSNLSNLSKGEHVTGTATISNLSECIWISCIYKKLAVACKFINGEGAFFGWDSPRSYFNFLAPGQAMTISVSFFAPTDKGSYKVIVSLVREHSDWLDLHGFEPAVLDIVVS